MPRTAPLYPRSPYDPNPRTTWLLSSDTLATLAAHPTVSGSEAPAFLAMMTGASAATPQPGTPADQQRHLPQGGRQPDESVSGAAALAAEGEDEEEDEEMSMEADEDEGEAASEEALEDREETEMDEAIETEEEVETLESEEVSYEYYEGTEEEEASGQSSTQSEEKAKAAGGQDVAAAQEKERLRREAVVAAVASDALNDDEVDRLLLWLKAATRDPTRQRLA